MKNTLYPSLLQGLLIGLVLLSGGCSIFRERDSILSLNGVYTVSPRQVLYYEGPNNSVQAKVLKEAARAGIYQREDTLFVEFLGEALPPADRDPLTLDRADSSLTFFTHYLMRSNQVDKRSPWFRYRFSSFDVDLFTVPFKYRFGQAGQPGELITNPNVGVYVGFRHDEGIFRTVYYRKNRRSDIRSFSFGVGGFGMVNPVFVAPFSTAGRYTGEYEGLGISYGVAGILGYKSLTVGLALGYENLMDENNPIWIYRNKPWLGLTVGLNLN